MAINQNHTCEELDGVKCAIVEKNASPGRVEFLKWILEGNGYTVIAAPSPAPKAAAPAPKPVVEGEASATETPTPQPPPPTTFTVGVTDLTFNTTNALYGRLLRTDNGHTVTVAYWQQKEKVSHDEVPYYEQKSS
jgi:hypothetical protein